MKRNYKHNIASTEISIPVSTQTLVDRNHPISLVFHMNKKNESVATQCNPDEQYFTAEESPMMCKICIYANPMTNSIIRHCPPVKAYQS